MEIDINAPVEVKRKEGEGGGRGRERESGGGFGDIISPNACKDVPQIWGFIPSFKFGVPNQFGLGSVWTLDCLWALFKSPTLSERLILRVGRKY